MRKTKLMQYTDIEIEKRYFSYVLNKSIAPSRKDMVSELGITGEQILEAMGEYAEIIEKAWNLDEDARVLLAKEIIDAPEQLHKIVGEISFVPVWTISSKVIARKNRDPNYDPTRA